MDVFFREPEDALNIPQPLNGIKIAEVATVAPVRKKSRRFIPLDLSSFAILFILWGLKVAIFRKCIRSYC